VRRRHEAIGRIYAEYHAVNNSHFGGLLRPVRFDFTRLTPKIKGRRQVARTVASDEGNWCYVELDDRYMLTASWPDLVETLRHEMVHVWQAQMGYDLNHGPTFRKKAKELGISERAVD